MDVAQRNGGVDGAGDEDNRQRDSESDLGDQRASGQQRRRLDVFADEGVAQRTGERVDADLDSARGPDRLHVLLGSVHFVHERELANGEAEREDDVGHGNESLREAEVLLGPGRPVDGRHSARLVTGLDTCGNDGDADGDQDGGKVNVTQDRDFREGGRDGEDQENDGRNGGEGNGADVAAVDVDERDTSRQGVRTDDHDKLENKGGTEEFVAETAEEETTGICVGRNLGVLQLDLADNVTREDGDGAEADCEEDAREHAENRVCLGQGKCAEGNGLDDCDDCKALPAQTVEVSITVFGNLLCARCLLDLALTEDLVVRHVGALVLFVLGRASDLVVHGGCVEG